MTTLHQKLPFARNIKAYDYIKFLPVIIFFLVSVSAIFWLGKTYLRLKIVDDSYYYIIVARNLIEVGESSLLPGIPTNGYHPLWMIMLAAVGIIFGFSLTVVKILEITVVCIGFVLFIRLFRIRSLIEAAFYTFVIWFILRSFALYGMETTLLFPALVFLFASMLSHEPFIVARRPFMIFLSCGLVIGARLDAAFFVLPMLAVAPISRVQKLHVLLGLLVCGSLYAGVNLALFGAALPISASVKSLGGVQFNELYFTQLVDGFSDLSVRRLIYLFRRRLITLDPIVTPWLAALVAGLSAFVVRRIAPGSPLVPLIYAAVVGMLLFGAKLFFGSSWWVWVWYGFPTIIFALLVFWIIQEVFAGNPVVRLGMGVLALYFFTIFVSDTLAAPKPNGFNGFIEINRRFLEANAALLGAEVVAMGDRAGSFAYQYEGGVYQTEGLVNSASYLDVLKAGGDIRKHLCSMGIELFLDYEVPHSNYDSLRIEILRPHLTSFPGPYLTVYKSEEIAHFEDIAIYDNRKNDEGDYRLYVWRLDCQRSL